VVVCHCWEERHFNGQPPEEQGGWEFELLAHVSPFLAVVGEEGGDETDRPGEKFGEYLQWVLVVVIMETRILTLPAHSVSHTIISQIENQTSLTPPTFAFGNAKIPTIKGMRIKSTMGVMYVKYRTSHDEL
jgi:hypothetical protein